MISNRLTYSCEIRCVRTCIWNCRRKEKN